MPTVESWFHRFESIQVILKGADQPVEVTPVMFLRFPSESEAGCGLVFSWPKEGEALTRKSFYGPNGRLYLHVLLSPHNFFDFWRCMLLVDTCECVDDALVQLHIPALVCRRRTMLDEHTRRRCIEQLSGGEATLEELMHRQIPEWLVEFVLKEWSKPYAASCLWAITDEVRAGTIEWSEDFEALGVMHPDEEDRQNALWAELLPRYRAIVRRIARACHERVEDPTDERASLLHERDALIALADAGCEEEHGPYITAALAYIAGKRNKASNGVGTDMMLMYLVAAYEVHPLAGARIDDLREERLIKAAAHWVAKRWRHGHPFEPGQVTEMSQTLRRLLNHYFPFDSHVEDLKAYLNHRYGVDLDTPKHASEVHVSP